MYDLYLVWIKKSNNFIQNIKILDKIAIDNFTKSDSNWPKHPNYLLKAALLPSHLYNLITLYILYEEVLHRRLSLLSTKLILGCCPFNNWRLMNLRQDLTLLDLLGLVMLLPTKMPFCKIIPIFSWLSLCLFRLNIQIYICRNRFSFWDRIFFTTGFLLSVEGDCQAMWEFHYNNNEFRLESFIYIN